MGTNVPKQPNIPPMPNKQKMSKEEWLAELKMYREIIDTAEEKIKDIYGAVIVEGYADIFDQLKEIRRVNND